MRLLDRLFRRKSEFKVLDLGDPKLLRDNIDAVLTPIPVKPKRQGRVIKQTRHSEFDPNPSIKGGRVVKVMPRQLQKIKAAQEMVESDDGPKVEDLED